MKIQYHAFKMQLQSWLLSDCDYKYCGQQQKNTVAETADTQNIEAMFTVASVNLNHLVSITIRSHKISQLRNTFLQ